MKGTKMKTALNGATTMNASLETDIRAAQAAGFDYLEIWAAKLRDYLAVHTTTDLQNLFAENGIGPYSINSIEHITFRDPEGYASVITECQELCRIAQEINCPYLVVVPGLLPALATREQIIEESARVLNELADIAQAYDVKLAFEFLGQTDCSVQTLELAKEIVEKVDRADVGLVIDSFHFYAGGSQIAAIETLAPEQLFIFHINDAEDLPRLELEDRHRLLPGLGILPLKEIISAFARIKYDKVVSVEIFRPEYWQRDPFELAKAARQAIAKVFS
jgi:2-keto-myo-inositol isomerase